MAAAESAKASTARSVFNMSMKGSRLKAGLGELIGTNQAVA
jgi:hypothetical protein